MKKFYEAWKDEDEGGTSTSFGTAESINLALSQGNLSKNAALLHRIEADTYEEAWTLHYEMMGYPPYQPPGEPAECPNACGSIYYPKGSSECPICGKIG